MLHPIKSLDYVSVPYRSYPLGEALPELLQQLHSCKPLRCSGNQRELARKALTALNNRQSADIRILATSLASDVARIVD